MFNIARSLNEVRQIAKRNRVDLGTQFQEIIETYKILTAPVTELTNPTPPGATGKQLNLIQTQPGTSGRRKGYKMTKQQRQNVSRGMQLSWAKRKLAKIEGEK